MLNIVNLRCITMGYKAVQSEPEEMVQTAVRMPRSLYDRLQKAGGRRGMSEEIRRRLEASFRDKEEAIQHALEPDGLVEPPEAETRRLMSSIDKFANEISGFYGWWNQDPFAHLVFKEGVGQLVDRKRPEGNPVPKPNPESLAETFFGEGLVDPAKVARTTIALLLHSSKKGEP
jgi:hypothetical protein